MSYITLKTRSSSNKSPGLKKSGKQFEQINRHAAGVDIGCSSHFVAVPEGRDEVCVREFKSFTSDLHDLAKWLKRCKIKTVAMESTGVYWIPLYELLESYGFEVKLVNARQVKNVSGRKTDILDCQWLQQLHTYGLLQGAFRPDTDICRLRAYLRQRGMLIELAASHIQHMQKALNQMNIQLQNVISDTMSETGMRIIRAIAAGEQDPVKLASYRDRRCKSSIEVIRKSLTGHYLTEHVFALKQAVELYDIYRDKMGECDQEIEKQLLGFNAKSEVTDKELKAKQSIRKNSMSLNVQAHLIRLTGVDLTKIPGVNGLTALKVISETGLDFERWRSAKAFASWLGLSPENKISGGKLLSSKSKRTSSRAATALRLGASSLSKSQNALGAYLRRMKGRIGAPKAITAVAHKIAILIYHMLKNGVEYVEKGQQYYEEQYRDRVLRSLKKRAESLGFALIESPINTGIPT